MQHRVYIYCRENFDGRIYVKINSRSAIESAHVQIVKDGQVAAQKRVAGNFAMFRNLPVGGYHAVVDLRLGDGAIATIESARISISKQPLPLLAAPFPPARNSKGGQRLYGNVTHYALELKLKKGALELLKSEFAVTLPKSHGLLARADLQKISLQPCWDDEPEEDCERYKISSAGPNDELVAIAQELEQLDYVIYCAVTPATQGIRLTQHQSTHVAETEDGVVPNLQQRGQMQETGDFTERQTYLRGGPGMNIQGVWDGGQRGDGVTIRIMEIALFPNHEDLAGNVTVVSTGDESDTTTAMQHHGTATTGCIAASNNGFGVTGIASEADCHFYAHRSFDQLVVDAVPGDLVLINLEFIAPNGNRIPVIDEKSWWDRIRIMSNRGVVVVLAAGNGGLDLSVAGLINDYGDSGGTLAGACDATSGRRMSFSNFGHRTSLYNSWGNRVATTGYGDLQFINNERSYTGHFNGTSSAAPLCCGALALIQAHTLSTLGVVFGSASMRVLTRLTGYAQGVADGIGHRPNALEAVERISNA